MSAANNRTLFNNILIVNKQNFGQWEYIFITLHNKLGISLFWYSLLYEKPGQ
jgi:hypothetical protein